MSRVGEDTQTRLTIAALAAVTIRGAEGLLPGLIEHVIRELDLLQREMRYWDSEPTGVLETLQWTRELLEKE